MSGPKVTFNPGPKILALLDRDEWWMVDNFSAWTQVVTGSGSVIKTIRKSQANSGTTASSTAIVKTGDNIGWSGGSSRAVLNWSKKVVIHAFVAKILGTANGTSRLTFGKVASDGIGSLTDKGIGIQIDDGALKGIVHDGAAGASVDLATTMPTDSVQRITIVSDGAGNIEWLVNGVDKGVSSAGPTGDSSTNAQIIQLESDNGGDAASQHIGMFSIKIYVEQ